jgi:hypothetical protein
MQKRRTKCEDKHWNKRQKKQRKRLTDDRVCRQAEIDISRLFLVKLTREDVFERFDGDPCCSGMYFEKNVLLVKGDTHRWKKYCFNEHTRSGIQLIVRRSRYAELTSHSRIEIVASDKNLPNSISELIFSFLYVGYR